MKDGETIARNTQHRNPENPGQPKSCLPPSKGRTGLTAPTDPRSGLRPLERDAPRRSGDGKDREPQRYRREKHGGNFPAGIPA